MSYNNNSHIYEKLSFLDFILSFQKILFRNEKIFFLYSNQFINKLISILKIPILKIDLFDEKYLSYNESLQYRKLKFLKDIIDSLLEKKFNTKYENNSKLFYLKKIIESFYYEKLNPKIDYFLLLEQLKKNGKFNSSNLIFYVNDLPNLNFFKKIIKEQFKLDIKKNLGIRSFYPFPILILKIFFQYIFSFTKIIKKKNNSNNPKIFIKYQKNMFDRFPSAGPLHWFNNSGLSKRDIFIYEDINLLEEKDKDEIQRKGFEHINLLECSNFFISPFKSIKNYKRFFSDENFFKDLEFNTIKFFIIWKVGCYEKIFKTLNVKLLNQHQEFSVNALSKYLALKNLNCVSFWSHWSSSNQLSVHYYYSFVDIILSWGKLDTDYYRIHNTNFEKIFEVGVIYGDSLDYQKKSSFKKIMTKEIKICIFDTSHSTNTIYVNTKLILKFYKKLFSFFEKKDNYKLYLKSKGSSFEKIKDDKEINSLYKKMLLKEKIEIISPKITPYDIARKSDLAISFDYNTAGIISGLSGVKSIFLNYSKLNKYPFHDTFKKNKISFDNFEEFEEFLGTNGIENIKHFDQDTKTKIDKYQDNNANLRSGEIILKTFLLINDKKNPKNIFENLEEYFEQKWNLKNKNVSVNKKNLWA